MKLSNKLLIGLLVILVGVLVCQAVVSAKKIGEHRKEHVKNLILRQKE